jgi:O-antigen ligase
MGGSLLEMETLGRIRITSTFGDPLTFGVFLMLGHFVYFIARARNLCLFLTRKTHPASLILLSICLLLTLTRAPMLGLVCGGILAAVLTFRITRKHLAKAAMAVASLAVVIIGLNAIISSQTFAASNNPVINSIQNGAESAWSLSQMAMGGSDDAESAFLVSQSKDDRSRAWTTGLEFLRSNPLGGGLAVDNIFSFSPGDVGLLAVGLQVGIIGLVALIATLLSVGLHGLAGLRSTHHSEARGVPILFLAAWVGILVTNGVTLLLETSVLAIPIWIFAGFILNSKQIFNSSSRPI